MVKYQLFRHLLNGTYPNADQNYLWHIDQRIGATLPLEVYYPKAEMLFWCMRDHGFDKQFKVPVNKSGVILDGAHRTACAAALGIKLPIIIHDTEHQWPDWGAGWFKSHGMTVELPDIQQEHKRLTERANANT